MVKQMNQGAYAPINGLKMYYEVHGEAKGAVPLLLLHGALSAIGTSFAKLLPGLSQSRQVIAIEQQGHGHTADVDRPLTFEQMADDTAALLDYLNVDQADIFGYSMGTGIALHLALRHPQKVRKLVLATTSYNDDGFLPGLLDMLGQIQPEQMNGTPWQLEYASVAPQPENWTTLVAKNTDLNLHMPQLSEDTVRSITAPTLLIFGDADIIRPEHAVQMFRLLGGGVPVDASGLSRSQLAFLPGTSHIDIPNRADLLLPMMPAFLDRP